MTVVPLADIGLSFPVFLAWMAIGLGILIGIAIAAAGIGVAIFGPRQVDSLIIPGLAATGALLVVLLSVSSIAPLLIPGLAGVVGIGTAGAQRLAIDHIDEESAGWPLMVLFGTAIAGVLIGGVLGFVFGVSSGRPALALSAAVVGGVVGLWLGWKGSRPIADVAPKNSIADATHQIPEEPVPPHQSP